MAVGFIGVQVRLRVIRVLLADPCVALLGRSGPRHFNPSTRYRSSRIRSKRVRIRFPIGSEAHPRRGCARSDLERPVRKAAFGAQWRARRARSEWPIASTGSRTASGHQRSTELASHSSSVPRQAWQLGSVRGKQNRAVRRRGGDSLAVGRQRAGEPIPAGPIAFR